MSNSSGLNSTPFLAEDTVLADKWIILGHIAMGGKGEVYLARQRNLDREVAVKIISPEFLSMMEEHAEDLEAEIQRFRREVLIMARIRHPNILQIYDFDEVEYNGQRLEFIVMEYIPGSTLRITMPDEGLADKPAELADWIRSYFFPVLSGMAAIHAQGIIHRDMKPENILMDGEIPKITDFGLSGGKWLDNVTRSHHILGTMTYMPREQFLDLPLTDARADVYALGKILFEAINGKMKDQKTYLMKTVELKDPDTPFLKTLNRVIRRATAENRNKRTPSVNALQKDLERALEKANMDGFPTKPPLPLPSRHSRMWMTAAAVLFCLFAGVLWLHLNMDDSPPVAIAPKAGESAQHNPEKTDAAPQSMHSEAVDLQSTITGDDGAVLQLIEGGKIVHYNPSTDRPMEMDLDAFYMEETEVTNHQYVEFLNANKERIAIDTDVVYGESEEVWLLLGPVMENYEPIIYKEETNRFAISNPSLASHPVVRVTPQGAQAYASFYGRRLPRAAEWHFAGKHKEKPTVENNGGNRPEQTSEGLPNGDTVDQANEKAASNPYQATDLERLRSVGELPVNEKGIRGMDANAMEWVIGMDADNRYSKFYILGRPGKAIKSRVHPIPRKAWEAFENVGFRTVFAPSARDQSEGDD